MKGYRIGTFPNGSVIVDEAVFTTDGEGQAKGILLEAGRRGLDVMVKDDRLYQETGGWGFEHFDRDTMTGTLSATARVQCQACRSKAQRDFVFSAVRP
jgi:Cytochrome P460